MKVELELNIVSERLAYLNFWDSNHGKDVVAELVGKKLLLDGKEISLADFVKKVKSAIGDSL